MPRASSTSLPVGRRTPVPTTSPVAESPTAPKNRRGPKINFTWREDFLAAYEAGGGLYAAAKTAGVNSTTVYDEFHRNPAFKAAADEARQRFADAREANLARLADNGNVVGDIVLLKKHRPMEYIERNLTMSVAFTTELPPEDGRQLLHAMFGAPPASLPTTPDHASERTTAPTAPQTPDRVLDASAAPPATREAADG